MSAPLVPGVPIDLTTCDREPIHLPGAIQPHGVLLAFDAAGLRVRSANAAQLGPLPALGEPLGAEHLTAELRAEIIALLEDGERVSEVIATEVGGRVYDVVTHRADGLLVVELEARPLDAPPLERFAMIAQRAVLRIQNNVDRGAVLRAVATEIRALTGFDRVMVYRFQPDESGLIEAEARRDDLEPFLGQRYPASDIPSQARRLYVLNPLRLIADVAYRPVALEPPVDPRTGAPLDLSQSVLRSVSPIHVEYLTNMGVRASMSISIVIGGKLWGLIACHHMSPRLAPHAIRMTCHLLAQTVSIIVDRAETAHSAAALERSLVVQGALLTRLTTSGGERLVALTSSSPTIADLIACDGAAVMMANEFASVGRVPSREGMAALRAWLSAHSAGDIYATAHTAADCPGLLPVLDGLCGFLAMRLSRGLEGHVIWFRKEERETVRWGGNPTKQYTVGPLGPRLTPRGSFEVWRELVLGRSAPWSVDERTAAERLRRELQEVAMATARSRILALEQSNDELDRLSYVVSHDLRAPLRAIASLSEFLDEDLRANLYDDALDHARRLHERVVKLDKLIAAIISYSRAGHRRESPHRVDVAALVREIVEMLVVPASVRIEIATGLPVLIAHATLLQQVLLNLIGNALKYGLRDGAGVISVGAAERGAMWELWVRDEGMGIDAQNFERIFKLFSRISSDASGTGVGLAIVRRIVESHGGRAWVESNLGAGATFRFLWPKEDPLEISPRDR